MPLATTQDVRAKLIDDEGALLALSREATLESIRLLLVAALKVTGDVAHDAVDLGSPVKIGGVGRSAAIAAVGEGDRVDAQYTLKGIAKAALFDSAGNEAALMQVNAGGGKSAATIAMAALGHNHRLNGSSWDPDTKPNSEFYLASSAANNNAQVARVGRTDLFYVAAYVAAAVPIYLKLFNLVASPDPATQTPAMVIRLNPGQNNLAYDARAFPAGLALALVTGAANLNNTAPAAGDVVALSIGYCGIT